MNQFPKIRNMLVCACCGKFKSPGLIICWTCHGDQKRRNDGGYSKQLEDKLERIETGLTIAR